MAGIYRCILLLIVGLFSSLSYPKNTEILFYEEGISLFDVEATLQPDGGSTSKKIFIFRREISRLSTDFIVIYHDSGCSLMGTLHC